MGAKGVKRRKPHHPLTSPEGELAPLRTAGDYGAYTPFGVVRSIGYFAAGFARRSKESRERRRWWAPPRRRPHI